jgi:hydrogenase maturation protein HypF
MSTVPTLAPDLAVCPDCLRELFDPADRRYRYPFISCSNCGPRLTAVTSLPYTRANSSMGSFDLCPDCAREYDDKSGRRFRDEMLSCPVCGPHIWLELAEFASFGVEPERLAEGETAIKSARAVLTQGKIVAIKGWGGFHLACDAFDAKAVSGLRQRKLRVDKPFELMMPDIETVVRHCYVNDEERALLESPARPIVVLKRRPESTIVPEVAPGQNVLYVALPCTPLDYLLIEKAEAFPEALVMTSGNLGEEPVVVNNEDARERLLSLADVYLMHDREIQVRCDDSLVRVVSVENASVSSAILSDRYGTPSVYPLRRSRGYAPLPIHFSFDAPSVLACGAELKNTFCLFDGQTAYLSNHIGDMDNYEALRFFERSVAHCEHLLGSRPEVLAHDMNPNFLSTRYALERASREGQPTIAVQHQHAHLAACMAERGLDGARPVLGVIFSGGGYHPDGTTWGGDFLLGDYNDFERLLHLEYYPLPGGDAAVRKPARTAMALLHKFALDWDETLAPVNEFCPGGRTTLRTQLEKNINAPYTSSMGRLFEAVSALAGVRQQVNYDGQAAVEFEALVDPDETGVYNFGIEQTEVRLENVIQMLTIDVLNGVPVSSISARFHNGVAQMVLEACNKIRLDKGVEEIILSGGVWQNVTLLNKVLPLLKKAGFTVYLHRIVPPNNGGISLGQTAVAAWKLCQGSI